MNLGRYHFLLVWENSLLWFYWNYSFTMLLVTYFYGYSALRFSILSMSSLVEGLIFLFVYLSKFTIYFFLSFQFHFLYLAFQPCFFIFFTCSTLLVRFTIGIFCLDYWVFHFYHNFNWSFLQQIYFLFSKILFSYLELTSFFLYLCIYLVWIVSLLL